MIAIDTNVLVRLIVKDDEIQARKALKLIQSQEQSNVFIATVVICEMSWVLESCYQLKKPEIIRIFESLLRVKQFNVQASDVVWRALTAYECSQAEFSDCLISAVSKLHGAAYVTTFDKRAAKSEGFQLVS